MSVSSEVSELRSLASEYESNLQDTEDNFRSQLERVIDNNKEVLSSYDSSLQKMQSQLADLKLELNDAIAYKKKEKKAAYEKIANTCRIF